MKKTNRYILTAVVVMISLIGVFLCFNVQESIKHFPVDKTAIRGVSEVMREETGTQYDVVKKVSREDKVAQIVSTSVINKRVAESTAVLIDDKIFNESYEDDDMEISQSLFDDEVMVVEFPEDEEAEMEILPSFGNLEEEMVIDSSGEEMEIFL